MTRRLEDVMKLDRNVPEPRDPVFAARVQDLARSRLFLRYVTYEFNARKMVFIGELLTGIDLEEGGTAYIWLHVSPDIVLGNSEILQIDMACEYLTESQFQCAMVHWEKYPEWVRLDEVVGITSLAPVAGARRLSSVASSRDADWELTISWKRLNDYLLALLLKRVRSGKQDTSSWQREVLTVARQRMASFVGHEWIADPSKI